MLRFERTPALGCTLLEEVKIAMHVVQVL